MIASFKHRGLKRLYEQGDRSKVPPEYVQKLERILFSLDNAVVVKDLDVPGYRLHPLSANYRGHWSIVVRDNWRVVFRFEDGQALDIDLIDYH